MNEKQIIEWLLEGDIALQYQVYRDLQAAHPGKVHFIMEKAGKPSRWNTLRAMRVLKHFKS